MQPNYAPPQYPQQFPQQAPQQPPAQFAPQFPQQAYPQQFAPQFQPPAPQPLAQGSIDDFYSQPAAGGSKALTFPVVGTVYVGIVERPITNGDIQQQTSPPAQGSVPQFFRDGRPKLTMRIPLQMQPSAAYPDGRATWFVKGADREELARAMAEAGAPEGAPEASAVIQIAYVAEQQSGAGMNPRKVKQVLYRRPDGAAPVAPPAAPSPAAVVAPAAQFAPPGTVNDTYQAPPQPDPAALALQQAQQVAQAQLAAQPVQPAAPVATAAPAPAAAPQPPAGLSDAQQALLAQLGG
jgi:hypothetical protein